MKVELVLNDDLELKAYIKELIKNEIINVSRTEISETVKEVLTKKVANKYNTETINTLIEAEVKKQVTNKIISYFSTNPDLTKFVDNRIKCLLDDYFKRLGLQIIKDNINA